MLTEAEHHLIRDEKNNIAAARKDVSADRVMVTSGEDFPMGSNGANLNLAFSSQNPVNHFAPSHTGHRDTTGNGKNYSACLVLSLETGCSISMLPLIYSLGMDRGSLQSFEGF
jgi:hypothetical protein